MATKSSTDLEPCIDACYWLKCTVNSCVLGFGLTTAAMLDESAGGVVLYIDTVLY